MLNAQNFISGLLAFLVVSMPAVNSSAQTLTSNKQYIYVLHLTARLHDPKAWTERDNAAVEEHFKRLQEAVAQGKVSLAGRTKDPLNVTFGVVIFEAPDDEAARQFMQTDPTIVSGVMSATLHPYSVALMRK